MTLEILRSILGWCSLVNIGLLSIWLLFFLFAHDWLYRLHTKWFDFSIEKFDAIHYALMGMFKILIIMFMLVPYLVIRQLTL